MMKQSESIRKNVIKTPYISHDYSNLLCLIAHNNSEDLVESIWNLVYSFFLFKSLTYVGWMPAASLDSKLTDDEEYLVLLMVHLKGVTTFNTHKMSEMVSCIGGLLKTEEIGLAIRPSVALLNHSCWPNTVRCTNGSDVVIMATFTIQPGEEVSDIYTESFHEIPKEARQTKCSSYKFTCTCQACKEDWPQLNQLPSSLLKTQQNMFVKHLSVSMVVKLGEVLNAADREAKKLFSSGQTIQALAVWREMCVLAETRIKHPSRIFIIIRDSIQACLWRLYGTSKYEVRECTC